MKDLVQKRGIFARERINLDFSKLDNSFAFTLGRVNFCKAHPPVELHTHNGSMEIVFLVKGRQVYSVGGKDYQISSGDVFIAFANEIHSSGQFPQDKSLLYHLIVDLKALLEYNIGYNCFETSVILKSFEEMKSRRFRGSPSLKAKFDSMIRIYYSMEPFKKTFIRNIISEILIELIYCEKSNRLDIKPDCKEVIDYINENICSDLSVPKLAAVAGLSVSRFKSKFLQEVGIPPREYVLRQKVEAAKKMLAAKDFNITEIAHELCFSSSQYFCTVFKRFTLKSPNEFKASLHKSN